MAKIKLVQILTDLHAQGHNNTDFDEANAASLRLTQQATKWDCLPKPPF